jgi:hypothetical protein
MATSSEVAARISAALVSCACGSPAIALAPAASTQPKYAAFDAPLSRDHAYLSRAPAPDFWSLAPYYVGQQDDVSCSLATLTMLVNAARRSLPLRSDEPLITQPSLRARVASPIWERGLAPGGPGVTLEQLASLAKQSLQAFGVKARRVEVTHVSEATPAALEGLRTLLLANEASDGDWLLLNFWAKNYVGTGSYGHIAPVGAYDADGHRVLILDPDRGWYEPYWLPDEIALQGMATLDTDSGQPRGYVYVSVAMD